MFDILTFINLLELARLYLIEQELLRFQVSREASASIIVVVIECNQRLFSTDSTFESVIVWSR